MSELGDRFRRAVEGQQPSIDLDSVLVRAGRRERRRRVTSGVVAFAMFGSVVGAVWLGTRPERNGAIGESPTPTTSVTPTASVTEPSPSTNDPEVSPAARVACEEGGATALDPEVDALEDGVHFSVENRTDGPVRFNDLGPVEPGRTEEIVLQLRPGKTEVYCMQIL